MGCRNGRLSNRSWALRLGRNGRFSNLSHGRTIQQKQAVANGDDEGRGGMVVTLAAWRPVLLQQGHDTFEGAGLGFCLAQLNGKRLDCCLFLLFELDTIAAFQEFKEGIGPGVKVVELQVCSRNADGGAAVCADCGLGLLLGRVNVLLPFGSVFGADNAALSGC